MSCPNCGAPLDPVATLAKVTTCTSCATTLLLEDGAYRAAGRAGVMHEVPLLFGLGDTILCAGQIVHIQGHARFSYGRGFWDEFWGLDEAGHSTWVSVDEGDIILQHPVPRRLWPTMTPAMRIGRSFDLDGTPYTILEEDTAECLALRGSFDELLQVGERYRFINAQSDDDEVLSAEIGQDEQRWFTGRWIDPFDIVIEGRHGT